MINKIRSRIELDVLPVMLFLIKTSIVDCLDQWRHTKIEEQLIWSCQITLTLVLGPIYQQFLCAMASLSEAA